MSLKEEISRLEQRCEELDDRLKYYGELFDKQAEDIEARLDEHSMLQRFVFSELEEKNILSRSLVDVKWLYKNRMERMDASLRSMFETTRAEFHMDRYRFASDHVKGRSVGDIACGTGYGTALLYAGGAEKIVGIDLSLDAIKYAKKYYLEEGMEFIACGAHNTPLKENSLDVLVSFETLEHLEDEKSLLEEFQRVLRPDGLLIISTPNDWGIDDLSPFHVKSYDYAELVSTLSDYFLIENIYNQNSGTPNRKENNGQPKGIIETTSDNHTTAECFIAVCKNKEIR